MIYKTDFQYGEIEAPKLSTQYLLPENLWPTDTRLLAKPLDVRAAFAFERKGFISLDEIGKNRNDSYARSEDPILVQAIWLVEANQTYWLELKSEHNKILAKAKEEKRQALLAEQERIARELEELG